MTSDVKITSLNLNGYDDFKFTQAKLGQSSNDVYYYASITSPSSLGYLQRLQNNGTSLVKVWSRAFDTFTPISFCMDIDQSESNVYLLTTASSIIFIEQLDASSGSYNLGASISSVSSSQITTMQISEYGDILYFTTESSTDGYIWNWWPNSTSDWNSVSTCVIYTGFKTPTSFVIDQDNQNKVFLSLVSRTSPEQLEFRSVDYLNSSFNIWASHIDCPGSSWDGGFSIMKYDSTLEYLYWLMQYDSTVLFFNSNGLDGSLIGSMYKASVSSSCTNARAIEINSNSFYLLFSWSSQFIEVYDNSTSSFIASYESTDTSIVFNSLVVDSTYAFFIGEWSPFNLSGYIGQTLISSLESSPHLTKRSSSLFIETTDYTIISDTATASTALGANISMGFNISVTTTDEIDTLLYFDDSITQTDLDPATDQNFSISLMWSETQTNALSYSTTSYNGSSAPTWASVNSTNKQLVITSPDTSSSINFTFAVASIFGAYSFSIPVSLNFQNTTTVSSACNVDNCVECDSNDDNICINWKSSYEPSRSGSSCVPNSVEAIATATSGIMAAGFTASMSTPQGAWSLVNQFQIFLLMPLTDAYFPPEIIAFLTGLDFSLFSFSFLPIKIIFGVEAILDLFDYSQSDDYYVDMGFNSGSAFVNHFNLLVVFITISILHLIYYPIYRKVKKWKPKGKVSKIVIKMWMFLIEILTFDIYIRLMIEAYLFLTLSSITEIYKSKLSNSEEILSYTMSILIFGLSIAFIVITFWQWKKSRKPETLSKQFYFKELFMGVKDNWLARSYTLMFLSKWVQFL